MVAAGLWWNRNAAKGSAFSIEPERNIDAVRPPSFWQRACLGADLDPGWLAMVGSGGKRVYVLPSQELVIARLGRSSGWDDGAFLRAVSA
jgi:CubicO group peptidase (beta-lactamase class C family)